jgi:hypothetical protein
VPASVPVKGKAGSELGYRLGYPEVQKTGTPIFMSLTELEIRAAKPKPKAYKLYDEKGLFILVKPSGGRLWRFKYAYSGVEKLLSFFHWALTRKFR